MYNVHTQDFKKKHCSILFLPDERLPDMIVNEGNIFYEVRMFSYDRTMFCVLSVISWFTAK